MQAMILAAGYGTRLLPYTKIRPKPLFPLLNTPLLVLTIKRLKHAGFDHILVNCHHLGNQIKRAVEDIPGVFILEEHEILGTGGGLRNGYEKMRKEPLLITNGDIYHTIDFADVYHKHLEIGASASLTVHDFPRFNSLLIDGEQLVGFGGRGVAGALAFTGIHVIDPEILKPLPIGQKSCIIKRYTELLGDQTHIVVQRVDGQFWTDMGTPADYLALHGDILGGRVPRWAEIGSNETTPVLIADSASIGEDLRTSEWVCIGRAQIGNNVYVARSVIWDGALIPDHTEIIDTIVSA